jgi:hypothetical protein
VKNGNLTVVFACLLVIGVCGGMVFAGARTDDPLGVAVSPQNLLLGSVQSGSVSVHTDIPLSSVDTLSLDLNGIPASGAGADALGNLVARFPEADVKAIVSPPGATLTLTGSYLQGGSFSGSDTVKVVE